MDKCVTRSEKKARNEAIVASRAASTTPVEVARTASSAGPPTTTRTTTTSATSPSTPTTLNTPDKVRSAPMSKEKAYRPQAKRYAGGNGEGSRQEAPESDEEGHRLQKKASQELAASQRAADARKGPATNKTKRTASAQTRHRKKKARTDTPHRDGDESSDASSTPSLRAEDEHPPSISTPRHHDINIVEPGQLAVDGYEPMDSGDKSAHNVGTDREFAALWDDQGEGEDTDDMTDDIETDESPVDIAGPTPRTRLSSPRSAANNWRKLNQEEMADFARDADAVRAMRDDGWELDPEEFPENAVYEAQIEARREPVMRHSEFLATLQTQPLDVTADDFKRGTSSPGPGTPHEARTANQRGHELVECPVFQTIGGVQRRRARQCKVCSLRKKYLGERVNTRWNCQTRSLSSKTRAYLCNVVRPHSANGNTCHQVWHLEWDHGRNRPRPYFGRDNQMRVTGGKQRSKRRRPTAGQVDEGTDAATADD
ncbi:hypothetical protein PI124_g9569 [Phytophthora idaei]|nr:hypothetical protein PI124_g9569 [Phytophthora idaei]